MIMIVFENMENLINNRKEKFEKGAKNNASEVNGLFDDQAKHIFRTAPDGTS